MCLGDRKGRVSDRDIFRLHRSTVYVGAAYCYRRASVVCRSVCHDHEFCRKRLNGLRCRLGYGLAWPKEACVRWGAHWRHLVNTVELSMCSSDAAFCEITLTTTCSLYHNHQPRCCSIICHGHTVLLVKGKLIVTAAAVAAVAAVSVYIRRFYCVCVCSCAKKDTRMIRQLQYTAWPDHGVPSNCQHFLEFVHAVRQEIEKHSTESQPTLVHCR